MALDSRGVLWLAWDVRGSYNWHGMLGDPVTGMGWYGILWLACDGRGILLLACNGRGILWLAYDGRGIWWLDWDWMEGGSYG